MKVITDHIHQFVSARRLFVAAMVSLFVIPGLFFAKGAFADDASASNDQRLVTIHDNGSEITIVTRAITVKSALEQADIAVESGDIVEPALSERLIAKTYQVNVFRARPVVVDDGVRSVRVMTAEQSPRQIAKAANVPLYDEDTSQFKQVSDVIHEGGAGVKLLIDRATPFYFTQYGKRFEARTQTTTVSELLKEKNISLGPDDGVSPALTSPLVAGMEVKVWRNGKQTITQEETIVKAVEEVKDTARDIGFREVQTAGADGKRNATYEIEMRDGVEVSRKEIASVTTLEPVKQVVVVGAKPKTYTGSHADWMIAAGISPNDFDYVERLIQKESGWRPDALNSSSGACGLVQALPCSKLGPNWNDPVVALRWGQGYVTSRYGGWAGAWQHSQNVGWY